MKKFLIVLLSLIMGVSMFAFAACSDTPADDRPQTGSEQPTPEQPDKPDEPSQDDEPDEPSQDDEPDEPSQETTDILVVYFSATGNTERVAGYIAETTGGDLFELVPVDPYTDDDLDWTNDESRVSEEHENENLRDVELTDTTVDDWAEYDVVFIGYPIWWYDAAWPVNGFVEDNDFTGKTVYTFCTSSSSGLGNSTQNLAEMAGGSGTWLDGQRFSSGASEATVTSWIESLNIL